MKRLLWGPLALLWFIFAPPVACEATEELPGH